MTAPEAGSLHENPSGLVADTVPPRRGGPIFSRAVAWLRRTPLWPLLSIVGVGAFQILAMASTLLRSKVVALSLGPGGVGATALLDQIVVLGGQVCVLGMTMTATKFLSAAHSDGDEAFGHAYWTFLRLVLLLSAVGALGTAVFLQFRVPAIEVMGFAAVIALAIVPINAVATIQTAMAASRRVRAAATYGLVTTVLVSGVSAAATGWYGLHGYYTGTLIALAGVFGGGAWYMRDVHDRQSWLRNPIADLRQYRTAVGSAAVLYASSLSAPLADLVPRYVMSQAHTLEATGLLQAAFGLALAVRAFVRPSFSLFLIPTLNRRTSAAQKMGDAASFTQVMVALTTIMALVIVLFPGFWLSALYTSKFVAVAPWVYLFLIGVCVQLVGTVHLQLLFALEELRSFVLIAVSGDILTCLITVLLVPAFGIPAVAIGLIADGLVMCLASAWLLRRRHGLNLARAAGPLPFVALASLIVVGLAVPTRSLGIFSALARAALWLAAAVALLAWLRRASGGTLKAVPVASTDPLAKVSSSVQMFARD